MEPLKISYKVCMEADDIGQSRIHASIAFVKSQFENARNVYLRHAAFDDESDLDAFALRFYVEHEVFEESCASPEDAQSFVLELAQVLDAVAAAHSFMDMEGEFSWSFQGEEKRYVFQSEGGVDYCDFAKE
ncbi:MAG: hypothetical protein K2N87_11890 [Eubacterium sp.]|nr:hypothetical protein [Eubacterium sp.]